MAISCSRIPPAALPPDEARRRIRAVVHRVPRGRVVSYGQVAQLAGLPGRARLVGRVLGEAPDGQALPWHRVLSAQGRIALPLQSEGFAEQCRRLRAEGVAVRDGRVDLRRYAWQRERDSAPLLD